MFFLESISLDVIMYSSRLFNLVMITVIIQQRIQEIIEPDHTEE